MFNYCKTRYFGGHYICQISEKPNIDGYIFLQFKLLEIIYILYIWHLCKCRQVLMYFVKFAHFVNISCLPNNANITQFYSNLQWSKLSQITATMIPMNNKDNPQSLYPQSLYSPIHIIISICFIVYENMILYS